jgi:Protein of unknown function (DUF2934)
MNPAVEERIRTRAYELWEAEGRPGGREVEHWLQAAQEVAAEDGGGVGETPAPAPVRRTRSASGSGTARRTAKVAPSAAAPAATARPATGRARTTTKTTRKNGSVS